MIAYARLTPGPGFAAGRALLYYLQRLVTVPVARRAVSSAIAALVKRGHGVAADEDPTAWSAGVVSELERDGLAVLPPLLPKAAIDRMARYFMRQPVLGPGGAPTPLSELPPDTPEAVYPLETALDCPDIGAVLNSPLVMRIASDYLGCKPTVSSLGVRWSFPTPGTETRTQSFHRDLDDWRFLKLFIYLTDVDAGSGPHTYVRRSHRSSFGFAAKVYARAELEARFGTSAVSTVTGPRGTTFIADTLGVHRGDLPETRPRLILQLQYSLLPVFAFAYSPVERAGLGVDRYCHRLLLHSPPQAGLSASRLSPARPRG